MAVEQTFSILKPDVTRRNLTGAVNAVSVSPTRASRLVQELVDAGYLQRGSDQGDGRKSLISFTHKGRRYSEKVARTLENAILKYRDVMGATNPEKADAGTIRKEFALSMGENSVHGSDAPDTAAQEIAQFFKKDQVVG